MRVLIATVQTPFVRGGAELLAESLLAEVLARGHAAEIVTMPFKWYPADRIPDAMLIARLMEVSEWCGGPVDRLIGLKFPAYLMRHPSKTLWILHQYRGAYDLWDAPMGDLCHAPDGAHVREAIRSADRLIAETRAVYTISRNVSRRLLAHNAIESEPLYHPPPNAGAIRVGEYGDYFLCPGRINETKRQHLIVEALALAPDTAKIVFMGAADSVSYLMRLRERCEELGVADRVVWTGLVDEARRLALYADCRAVLVPPFDEDYGYVTLEAMLAGKAVVTCTDSGGPLDFVTDRDNGLVRSSEPEEFAEALAILAGDTSLCRTFGTAGLARYRSLGLDWNVVVERLLA